ncbi:MAG: DUF4527 domain-containing protein [Paludibacteraceae bacterium]|nr:DUF4527 domain-containing protein [Paludibacteraceae bacterium]
MKKLILLVVAAVAFCSCDQIAKHSSAYKQMTLERDSLAAVQEKTVAEMDNYLSIISEVDSNFQIIKENEDYISVNANGDGVPNNDWRARMADNFYAINSILEANKAKIAELQSKVDNGSIQSSQLRKTVARLTAQLEEKNQEILALQQELEKKNIRIDSLVVENTLMTEQARQMVADMEEQNKTIQNQDEALNRAYYLIATKSELKENGIDAKNMSSTFRNGLFTAIDIRDVEVIPTNAKRAKVLTKHPATSYTLERDENRMYVLVIRNATDFWSTSKHLIIKVD